MSWREAKTAFSACPDRTDENPVSVHSNESVEAGAEREEAVMAVMMMVPAGCWLQCFNVDVVSRRADCG